MRETLTSVLATAQDRRLLHLPRPAPVLRIEDVAFDQSGAPILLAGHVATTARHVYINDIR